MIYDVWYIYLRNPVLTETHIWSNLILSHMLHRWWLSAWLLGAWILKKKKKQTGNLRVFGTASLMFSWLCFT